jgi:hypothetical protein
MQTFKEAGMSAHRSSSFVRRVLVADAIISGVTGIIMMAGSTMLESLLGVPATLLRYAGASLLPFAAAVAWLARRESLPNSAVWTVIAVNALWAIDSIVLLFTGWIAPTMLGYAFIVFQAIVVAGLAELQYVGLRRSNPALA